MDPVMNQLARELADLISTVVAEDTRVEALRDKAREAGFDLRVSLDAAVTFVPLHPAVAADADALVPVTGAKADVPARPVLEMTATDRRFLKSLRIAADEPSDDPIE
ncbi:MAG: hypothetical protein AB7L71_10580 [Vicinamibacterales bacterium]